MYKKLGCLFILFSVLVVLPLEGKAGENQVIDEEVISKKVAEIKAKIKGVLEFEKRMELIRAIRPLVDENIKELSKKKYRNKYVDFRAGLFIYESLLELLVSERAKDKSKCDEIRSLFILYFSPRNPKPHIGEFPVEVLNIYELWSVACDKPEYMKLPY